MGPLLGSLIGQLMSKVSIPSVAVNSLSHELFMKTNIIVVMCASILLHRFYNVNVHLHNNVFAHGTVTNDDRRRRRPCVTIKGLGQLDKINTYQHLWGHQLGSSPSRTTSYPQQVNCTYQISILLHRIGAYRFYL